MSGGWLEVHGASGVRREALPDGWTRIGGGSAEIALPGVGDDQLFVSSRPPCARFAGRGTPPRLHGEPLLERALRPGDRIEWAGTVLVYGGEAESRDLASLEELASVPASSALAPSDDRLAARVRAGIACELELVERSARKRWQAAVLAGTFEPDGCARELLASVRGPELEGRLLERSGSLLRDFLMADHLSGARGVGRKLRGGARNMLGFLVAQAVAFLVFSALMAGILLLLRVRGESVDGWLDRVSALLP